MSAPEKLTIETPEQVALEFPLAGIGSRFLAVALDTLIQVAIGAAALIGTFILSRFTPLLSPASGKWLLATLILGWFLINTGYFAIFESIRNGRTPGKRLAGIRVIALNGGPITVYAAILRNLIRVIDQLPGMYGIAILSVLVTRRQQRLGDLAAGTVVVHDRLEQPVAILPVQVPAVPVGGHMLAPADIALIEAFLQRRGDLDSWVRRMRAREIAQRMAERLHTEIGDDEERFLERLAAEYRGRRYGLR